MVRTLSLLVCLAGAIASLTGCDSLRLDGESTFFGTIVDAATMEPIAGALVLVDGEEAVSDSLGRFSVTIEADSSGQPFVLQVSALGYEPAEVQAEADVRDEVEVDAIRLLRGSTGPGPTPGAPSGPGTSVTLLQRSTAEIAVTGAGGVETTSLEFVVLDASGRPVDSDHAVVLSFEIASGPGGGEMLSSDEETTDENGTARVVLTSGTRSGTVQVLATGSAEGVTLRSLPVVITITGGLPDADHFSIAPERLNFAGYNRFGLTNPITAFVGDIYGNPVQVGTAVYFTTDGGIIPGAGATDPAGTTTVNLLSAAPRPSNPLACSPNPNGYAIITGSTSDMDQVTIESDAVVLFSGVTGIRIDGPSGLELGTYSYTVADQFDHPLSPGTSIAVEVDGVNVKGVGDIGVELGDFLCPGPGSTSFRFTVLINDPAGEAPVLESITITVESENGNAQFTRTGVGGVARDRLSREEAL